MSSPRPLLIDHLKHSYGLNFAGADSTAAKLAGLYPTPLIMLQVTSWVELTQTRPAEQIVLLNFKWAPVVDVLRRAIISGVAEDLKK